MIPKCSTLIHGPWDIREWYGFRSKGQRFRLWLGLPKHILSRVYTSATCCTATSCADEQHVAGNKLLVERNMLLVRATILLTVTSNMLPRNMLRWCKRGFRLAVGFTNAIEWPA